MTPDQLKKISQMRGRELFNAMKWAYDHNHAEAISALKARAKEINNTRFGIWEKAVYNVDTMNFPNIPTGENRLVLEPIQGYPCEAYIYYKPNGTVSSSFISLINGKTNDAYVRYFIQNGEVSFT